MKTLKYNDSLIEAYRDVLTNVINQLIEDADECDSIEKQRRLIHLMRDCVSIRAALADIKTTSEHRVAADLEKHRGFYRSTMAQLRQIRQKRG